MQLFFLFGKKYLKKERHACRSTKTKFYFIKFVSFAAEVRVLRPIGALTFICAYDYGFVENVVFTPLFRRALSTLSEKIPLGYDRELMSLPVIFFSSSAFF